MIFIIGLGNPGKKFEATWHNLGRLTVANLRKDINFPEFKFSKKFNAFISQGTFEEKKIKLVLPETFMNQSGKTVRSLFNYYKPLINNFWIVHDDIDLILGKIKIVKKRGTAGHRGVESIIKGLKSNDFIRFRIGIQPQSKKPDDIEKFVLLKYKNRKIVKRVVKKTIEAIKLALKKDLETAMNRFN